jgi:sugar/nucleoside kinase (ribokinase family)
MVTKAAGRGRGVPTVVGTGLVALDTIFGLNQECAPQLRAGGTCGNVLAILAFLGWRSRPVGRLAMDAAGLCVRQDLSRWGVELEALGTEPSARTPVVLERIRVSPEGKVRHGFSVKCPNCGQWLPQYAAVSAKVMRTIVSKLPRADVVFIDRESPGALELAKHGHATGALVYYEPSGRCTKAMFTKMLAVTHILKYSHERTKWFAEFRPRGGVVPLEVETLGGEGLRYRVSRADRKGGGWKRLKPIKVAQLRDSAGAGDWCSAGIIHALGRMSPSKLKQLPSATIRSALVAGQAYAAWTCGFEGPRGGMDGLEPTKLATTIRRIVRDGRVPEETATGSCEPQTDVFDRLCRDCSAQESKS